MNIRLQHLLAEQKRKAIKEQKAIDEARQALLDYNITTYNKTTITDNNKNYVETFVWGFDEY